jgi:hypothetical protein
MLDPRRQLRAASAAGRNAFLPSNRLHFRLSHPTRAITSLPYPCIHKWDQDRNTPPFPLPLNLPGLPLPWSQPDSRAEPELKTLPRPTRPRKFSCFPDTIRGDGASCSPSPLLERTVNTPSAVVLTKSAGRMVSSSVGRERRGEFCHHSAIGAHALPPRHIAATPTSFCSTDLRRS